MKSLYVTDLDGTFFNSEKMVTEFSADIVNRFIAQGGLFTIATARMAYICEEKLAAVNLNIPGIIMNGACLYSFNEQKYLDVQAIRAEKVAEIETILDLNDCNAFMFVYDSNTLSIFHKKEPIGAEANYIGKRARAACREVRQVSSYSKETSGGQAIFFASTGSEEKIMAVWKQVQTIAGIESVVYSNIYNGLYCMDIFDENANKANALVRLKKLLQVDEVTMFGDNHNDVSIMRIAEHSIAPENAIEEVKQIVDEIIESCDNDGVAKFLQRKYNL